mmetsp:Transcript_27843/g.39075  ORF Transcript_27843/g.39075 Transcript_27843/m.39075 type:complete len:213 (-) Transcript_27843:696-1334(-)
MPNHCVLGSLPLHAHPRKCGTLPANTRLQSCSPLRNWCQPIFEGILGIHHGDAVGTECHPSNTKVLRQMHSPLNTAGKAAQPDHGCCSSCCSKPLLQEPPGCLVSAAGPVRKAAELLPNYHHESHPVCDTELTSRAQAHSWVPPSVPPSAALRLHGDDFLKATKKHTWSESPVLLHGAASSANGTGVALWNLSAAHICPEVFATSLHPLEAR